MAGRRQHTVPRFVLKGFGSRVSGNEVFVWLYRGGGHATESNIKNVGADRDFYGKPGGLSVDDQITKSEERYSALFDQLRTQPTGLTEAMNIPELIAHLSTRTRFLRQSMIDSMKFMLDRLAARLTNKVALGEILRGPLARRQLVAELSSHGVPPEQVDEIVPLLIPLLPTALEDAVPEFSDYVASFVDFAQCKFPEVIREAHIKALAARPDLAERADHYRNFHWHLMKSQTPLVLGDTICIFEVDGSRRCKPFDDADQVSRVFLPVSADRALIGTPYKAKPNMDSARLNRAAVRCSYEYFVSSVELSQKSSLPASIGKWSGILSEDELQRISDNLGLE